VELDAFLESAGLDDCAKSTVWRALEVKLEACSPSSVDSPGSPGRNDGADLPVPVDSLGSTVAILANTVGSGDSVLFADSATVAVGDGSIRASDAAEASFVDSDGAPSSTVSIGCTGSSGSSGVALVRVARFLDPFELPEPEGCTECARGAEVLDPAVMFFVPDGFFVLFVDDADDFAVSAGFTDADLDRVMRAMLTESKVFPRVSGVQRERAKG